ncbi:TIGR02281 family clan AA aspartic protease [soil metagenome]
MLRFVVIAAAATLSAVGAAQAVVMLDARHAAAEAPRAMVAETRPAAEPQGQAASITKAKDGHYWAEAQVNGGYVHFLVDTGATAVALSADDALRLGLKPSELDYAYKVTTANGEARAAKVKLASIAIAGVRVDNVDALVIDKGMESSLLGMSYLGRLSRFEATPTSLILRP